MSTQVCYGAKYETTNPVFVCFDEILNTILTTEITRRAVEKLLVMKKQGMEAKHDPAISAINAFWDSELLWLELKLEGTG